MNKLSLIQKWMLSNNILTSNLLHKRQITMSLLQQTQRNHQANLPSRCELKKKKKKLRKLETEIFVNLIRDLSGKPTVNIILNGERLYSLQDWKTRQGCLPSPFLYHTREPSQDNKERKRNKRHTDWKGKQNIVPIPRQHDCLCRKESGIEIEIISFFIYNFSISNPSPSRNFSLQSFPNSVQSQNHRSG